jgi:hypothetical protein
MGEEYAGSADAMEAAAVVLRKARREGTKTGYRKAGNRE